ncbi:MAG: MoaD/ThiS family protein [Actinomycetota bacterium]|nr:MoaD/ThiS family protein [Actinomycetota bacterium]
MDAPALKSTETDQAGGGVDVTLRMFAAARQEAGTGRASVHATTVGQVLDDAASRYGVGWARVVAISRVWVNGEPAEVARALRAGDEVAVLPPVSGGMA